MKTFDFTQPHQRRARRGELMLHVLEGIGKANVAAGDFVAAFLSAGYGASYGKLEREFRAQRTRRAKDDFERALFQKYHNLLYRLQKDGIVKKSHIKSGSFFSLTSSGLLTLQQLRNRFRVPLGKQYPKKASAALIIITFDIPESQRKKRDWLRQTITALGYKMVHKSVWIGNICLPKEFIADLRLLDIMDCVEIFTINKGGSIEVIRQQNEK